ncbi:hypothetical protein [Chlamydia sp.]|uniref:hypothetical protein n=1 Tax=Chlamydia sp. TaxID=35827 RepID=UPI0025BB1773|nr:hypothetical protein [Chlamydia sp.]MBQ8498733.1 hypothetical protein [Chlamydia sp.]
MFKLIKSAFLLGCCVLGYFWIRKESIVEHWLSQQLHTQVTVGNISPGFSKTKIRHLCIHNPLPSDRYPYAVEIECVSLKYSIVTMLLSKKIDISDVFLQGTSLTVFPYEGSTKTNWSFFWDNFIGSNTDMQFRHSQTFESTINTIPVFIKRCLCTNTRVHGIKNNHKEIPTTPVPSMEFRGSLSSFPLLTLGETTRALLYLIVEESFFHANISGDIARPLSKQARTYFNSSLSEYSHLKKDGAFPSNFAHELEEFMKELLFR